MGRSVGVGATEFEATSSIPARADRGCCIFYLRLIQCIIDVCIEVALFLSSFLSEDAWEDESFKGEEGILPILTGIEPSVMYVECKYAATELPKVPVTYNKFLWGGGGVRQRQ